MMKTIIILAITMLAFLCPHAAKGMTSLDYANNSESKKTVHLRIDEGKLRKKKPRSAIFVPSMELSGNTLYIMDCIPACTLQLVDESGAVIYEVDIPEGTEQWQLPTDQLEGYELRIVIDGVCYYCIL